MRIAMSSDVANTMLYNRVENTLRAVVIRFANVLRINSSAVRQRCGFAWRRRVSSMEYPLLRQELRFLLSQCGFRQIARFYQRIFRNAEAAVSIVGEFLTQMGMQHVAIFRRLMIDYEELCARNELLNDSFVSDSEETHQSGRTNPIGVVLNAHDVIAETSESETDISDSDEQRSQEQVITISDSDDDDVLPSVDERVEAMEAAAAAGVPQHAVEYERQEEEAAAAAAAGEEMAPVENEREAAGEVSDDDVNNEEEDYYSSSEEQDDSRFIGRDKRVHDMIMANYAEPINTVLQVTQPQPEPSTSTGAGIEHWRSRILRQFYFQRVPARERGFHNIENKTRMVWNYFDERDSRDRHLNEFFRRRLVSSDGFDLTDQTFPNLNVYVRRIMYVRRAQELRWFHDLVLEPNSVLFTLPENELVDLLERIHESFDGKPED